MANPPGTADLTFTATNQPILTALAPLMVSKAVLFNSDAANRAVTIYKVPSGLTAGATNQIVGPSGSGAFILYPGQTFVLPLSGLVLNTADSFQGFASVTNVVNISIGYVTP